MPQQDTSSHNYKIRVTAELSSHTLLEKKVKVGKNTPEFIWITRQRTRKNLSFLQCQSDTMLQVNGAVHEICTTPKIELPPGYLMSILTLFSNQSVFTARHDGQ